ncbi:hypothetical protein XA68_12591 [Ophiocordyceps unilateralis]|uniref:Peptidase S8/S53 domain-containing protein n=1 Tax=Ophiocordyceps unilateralis TaxID=268505 RepID=A0A2A9PCN6_OPHUN|nr:hypothetical protein XA68_12591 [Ophiocordyceps unilateralis]
MFRLQSLLLVWLSAAAVLAASIPSLPNVTASLNENEGSVQDTVVPAALLVECETNDVVDEIHHLVNNWGGTLRHKLDVEIFPAISFELANETDANEKKLMLEEMDGVKKVMRVKRMEPPAEGLEPQKSQKLNRRQTGKQFGVPSHHLMTQVDKMHAQGFKGSGIRIAVVDSGINYKLPMFGGCFGTGCRVAFGENLMRNGINHDPIDCHGHGTTVAALLAGNDEESGYVGVAPNATLGAYRIGDCQGAMDADTLLAGWIAAFKAKPDMIVSSIVSNSGQDWPQATLSRLVAAITDAGVPCITAFGNNGVTGLFMGESPGVGRGVIGVGSFPTKEQNETRQSPRPVINRMSVFSSYGPAWDLGIKPNLAAPGEDMVVPTLDGGYFVDSGTSLASPLVGGIAALVLEAREKKAAASRLPPRYLMNTILMSTAAPQKAASGSFISVAGQGGGLVQAWDAATAETVVYPASLAFNDSEHRVPSFHLRIYNLGTSKVEYRLSNVPAETQYVSGFTTDAVAEIGISHTTVVVEPNQFGKFSVSASDPQGLDPERLPVWSGWVAINGSDGSYLTVPYLGVASSMRSVASLDRNAMPLTGVVDGKPTMIPPNSTYILPDPRSGQRFSPSACPSGAIRNYVGSTLFIHFGTPILAIDIHPLDICPANPGNQSLSTADACVQTSKLSDFSFRYRGTYMGRQAMQIPWNGLLRSGEYAPPGRYKFVARALSVFGDVVKHDWEAVESPVFRIVYKHMCSGHSPL